MFFKIDSGKQVMAWENRYRFLGFFLVSLFLYMVLDLLIDLPPYGLEFRWEEVRAKGEGDSLRITGTYCFFPSHPLQTYYDLVFPLGPPGKPVPTLTGFHATTDIGTISHYLTPTGFLVDLEVEPGKEMIVHLSYSLPSPEKSGEYVTLSANNWPVPISSATFVLESEMKSNYHGNGEKVVSFSNFNPRENWKVSWK